MSENSEYIVDLPGSREIAFMIATPQYSKMIKRVVVSALNDNDAVRNYVFRTFRDKSVPRRICAALGETGGELDLGRFAFQVPQGLDVNLLAEEVKAKKPVVDAAAYSQELLDFYKSWKTNN